MYKKNWILFFAVFVFLSISACSKPDFDTTKGKFSYAIGNQIANNMMRQGIDVDTKAFTLAIEDVVKGAKSKFNLEEMRNALSEMTLTLQKRGADPHSVDQNKNEGKEGLEKKREIYSYAIGNQIGKNIMRQKLDIDVKTFTLAMEDAVKGNQIRLTSEEMRQAMKDMAMEIQKKAEDSPGAKKNKKEGEEYLAKNRAKSGVVVTASGLQYEVLRKGTGPKPKISDRVRVNYRGTLINGSEFDSSYKRNRPAEFALNGLISGWTEALQLMNVGSKFKLTIPSSLAYGSRENPGIPSNSVLIFELELLGIIK
jgi:FKBP-type peptidyl-prolyl cis-trans isomerase FkpA